MVGFTFNDRLARALIFTSLCLGLCPWGAWAQTYPVHTLRMIVPVPPGGIIDVVTRLVAQKVTEQTGQSVVVDNRVGGLTNVGSEIVARSPGDGYTLLMQSLPLVINPAMLVKLSYDYEKDLTPISLILSAPYLLVTHPSLPVRSMADLIQLARQKPGFITYSSAGNASNLHVAIALLCNMAKVDMLHIPYKGGGPALSALLGGEAALSSLAVSAAIAHVKNARLRALAISSPQRMSSLPDIPTAAETIAGYDFASWVGVLAPSSTPESLITTVHAVIVKAARAPDLVDRFNAEASPIVANTPAQFKTFIQSEARRWTKVVKESGIKTD